MMDQIERTRVLSDLVKINSVNGNELEVANYLRRVFEQHGLTADVQVHNLSLSEDGVGSLA